MGAKDTGSSQGARGWPVGGRNIPSGHFSTCFSCRHRSLEGELSAEDGQVAETDQLPRATLRFYEQEPKKQEGRLQTEPHPGPHPPATHQSAALATQAGVLEPGSHVLVRADHQGPDHEDLLPVLYNTLAALEGSETRVRPSSAPPGASQQQPRLL